MYLILNSIKLIVDISPHAHYVKQQDNGVVIGCDEDEADAIYSANTDKFYPLAATGYISDSHTLAIVDEVPEDVVPGYYYYHAGEFYTTEERQAALKKEREAAALFDRTLALEELVVDQAYQAALMELGVI